MKKQQEWAKAVQEKRLQLIMLRFHLRVNLIYISLSHILIYFTGLSAMIGGSPARSSPTSGGSEPGTERFSRKVFVGGLPPDIDEGFIFFYQTLTPENLKIL